jgi:RNA polymerase sigma-70 factor (ECF subfamily)
MSSNDTSVNMVCVGVIQFFPISKLIALYVNPLFDKIWVLSRLVRRWRFHWNRYSNVLPAESRLSELQIGHSNKAAETTFYRMSANKNWRELEDIELIRSAQSGDVEAFGEIYERYSQVIYRFLSAHLDNFLDAEDILSDVFLRVWRVIPKYQDRGTPFLVFLFRIARNRLIDYYRHKGNKNPDVSIDIVSLPDQRDEPGEVLVTKHEHAELRRVMKQLREDYRTVLILRFINGLSPDEAAQVMGRSVGAVRVLQHRALASLRELLNGLER